MERMCGGDDVWRGCVGRMLREYVYEEYVYEEYVYEEHIERAQ